MNNNEILQDNQIPSMSIADLHEDFWYLVFEFLPLEDQINVVKVFRHLKKVCQLANKKHLKVLSTKDLSFPNLDRALRWFGPQLEVLYVNDSFSPKERCECLRAVQKCCEHIISISFKAPVTKCLASSYEGMKSLHSIHMDYHVDSDDRLLKMFGQIPLLRSLHLTGFAAKKLEKLNGVDKVETLTLDGDMPITDFYRILRPFLNLRIFCVTCPGFLDLNYLKHIPLEEIDVSRQTASYSLPKFPTLKTLRINSDYIQLKVILKNRILYYANKLEKLHYLQMTDFETAKIISQFSMLKDLACMPTDPKSFLSLLELRQLKRLSVACAGNWIDFDYYLLLLVQANLQTLEYLDISYSSIFTTQFVYRLLDVLEDKKNLTGNRFKLIANCTYIDGRIMSMLGDKAKLIDITILNRYSGRRKITQSSFVEFKI